MRIIAIAAIMLLSAPSALGVVAALTPTRGVVAAWMAAIGFELTYLALATLAVPSSLRAHARATALVAVATAITLNVVADYAARMPDALRGWTAFAASFDPLLLALSFIESAPLAGLAYALATLLHRITSHDAAQTTARAPHPVAPAAEDATHRADVRRNGRAYPCPRCGAPLASQQAAAAAARHGGCAACRSVMSSKASLSDGKT